MPAESGKDFRVVANKLLKKADELLREVIRDTEARDNRLKTRKVHWTKRHRLQVLLEAAEETQKSASNVITAPWFLAELGATLDVVNKWKQSPLWPDIEKTLKDKGAFEHTIAMLHVAEHVKMDGYDVQVVKEGLQHSPDLMLQARGGTQDTVVIECYQPAALCGESSKLDSKEAKNIIETSMKKARLQIGGDKPGIIAICGYNQSVYNLRMLREAAKKRLSRTERVNLWGFWFMTMGVIFRQQGDKFSFQAMRSAQFIQSPAYFGKVDIVVRTPTDHPNLIKGKLKDVTIDALISGEAGKELQNDEAPSPDVVDVSYVKEVKLNIIQKPGKLTRSIIHGRGKKVPPLFRGQGNINYQCGRCSTVLAEHVWRQSLSNIVIQCPKCQSYNETTILSLPDYPTVITSRGNFYFSDAVTLRPGLYLRGNK